MTSLQSVFPVRRGLRALPLVLLAACLLVVSACAQSPAPSATTASTTSAASPRQRLSLDADWRFIKGDPADAGNLSYANIKPWVLPTANDFTNSPTKPVLPSGNLGGNVSYVQPGFDDSAWRSLTLPHDWGIEGPFSATGEGATGRLPWAGIGWYRRHLDIPASDAGQRFFLDIDGAMAYATVWCNGQFVGGWPYGYSSFQLDLTPYLKPGADNVLAIRLDNPPSSSRWYPGGGIYRNVWLEITDPVHVGHWGTYVTTPEISASQATVNLRVNVDNQSAANSTVTVGSQIFALSPDGQPTGDAVATATPVSLDLAANATQTGDFSFTVPNPKLWNLDSPNLYTAVTTVRQGDQIVDSYTTNFGIRTIKFDPDHGFFLNGQHVPINGVCDHADLGPLGTVVNVRGLERQIQLLKEMGCNAIRTSHNMPAPELLDLCDRLGMLVMDESFDTWETPKSRHVNDYSALFDDWHEMDIRAEVRRDRNHPSVILWSIGNEIGQQGSSRGNEILNELIGYVHEEDPTRMTVTANNGTGFSGFDPAEYVFGFNYEPGHKVGYADYHAANPAVCIIGSETASTISSRGVYVFPVSVNKAQGIDRPDVQVSSYDLSAPRWANQPDAEFAAQEKNPFVAGEFVWTGFDYLGEPTPFGGRNDPARSSYFGIMDLDGLKKDRFYLYQAHWRPDLPMAHILPHWNWPGRVGQVTPVQVYTSGDSAELFLNGQSLGKKTKAPGEYRLRWDDVVYQPGVLHVVAYKNGQVWAEDTVKTTGPAASVALLPDRSTIRDDGLDLSYVTVAIKDKDGLTVPVADNTVQYDISGPGEIVAVDNGDASSLAPIQGTNEGKVFSGEALVIVRAKPGQPGTITLTAKSDGLDPAVVPIVAAPGS
jgi:beta-galactosidase